LKKPDEPADEIEKLAKTDTLVLDQPAPVNMNIPELKAIRSIDSKVSDLALLQRVASLEKNSQHPFALAVLQAAKAKKFELLEVSNFKSFEGLGVTGFVNDRKMVVGNAALLRQEGINPGPLEALAGNLVREGFSVALVAAEGRPIGLISAQMPKPPEDNLKIADLQMKGFSVVQTPHDLTPEQKNDLVKKLEAEGAKVAVATEGLDPLLKKIDEARAQVKTSQPSNSSLRPLYYAVGAVIVLLLIALAVKLAQGA